MVSEMAEWSPDPAGLGPSPLPADPCCCCCPGTALFPLVLFADPPPLLLLLLLLLVLFNRTDEAEVFRPDPLLLLFVPETCAG